MNTRKKGPGIRLILIMLGVAPALVTVIALLLFARTSLTDGMITRTEEGLKLLAVATRASYESIDGEFSKGEDGCLYKGDMNITTDTARIDALVKGTDAQITLCLGKTRVATTLIGADGKRIIGTDIAQEVWDVVSKGETYTTRDIVVNGKDFVAIYIPVYNGSAVAGAVFAGQPKADIQAYINTKVNNIIFIGVGVTIVVAIVATLLSVSISKSISTAEEALNKLSSGDLNVSVPARLVNRSDEIGAMGRAVNSLLVKLREIVGNLAKSVEDLTNAGVSLESAAAQSSAAADEISSAVEDISKGAVSQAEEIESASSQIASMGNVIEDIVANVSNLTATADSMSVVGNESIDTINALSDSNDRANESISNIGAQIRNTDESIKKISTATDLITSIAAQTNLLSLNASIESARAGEAGKGFAVVASEIQKLAVQSNEAATEIQNIIEQLLNNSEKTLKEMQSTEVLVKEQQDKLVETKTKVDEVNDGIVISKQGTDKIKTNADDCDSARVQVIDVITNLSAISEENAASAEETTASMQELNATINTLAEEAVNLKEIAEKLHTDMQFFKL